MRKTEQTWKKKIKPMGVMNNNHKNQAKHALANCL